MKPIGLILSAGFGQRLKPLTNHWAKPLIPFLGTTPLALCAKRLIDLGLDEIWINTHYRGEDFPAYVKNIPWKINIHHEAEILGTGGALNFLRPKIGNREILIINGDVIADFDLEKLLLKHRSTGALATMMLLKDVIPGETAVWHNSDKITSIQKEKDFDSVAANFACAQVISPRFIDEMPKSGSFDIINFAYRPALKKGELISFLEHPGFWSDIGSLKSYYKTFMSIFRRDKQQSLLHLINSLQINATRTWLNKKPIAQVEPFNDSEHFLPRYVNLSGSCFIEHGALVHGPCSITDSIVLPGGVVHKEQIIEKSIIGPFGVLKTEEFT